MTMAMNALRAGVWRLRNRVSDVFRRGYRASVFTRIYEPYLWGEQGSVSGPGSVAAATAEVTVQLPEIWRSYGIKSLVDAPCGDCNWMSGIAPLLDRYTGIDIVDTRVIESRGCSMWMRLSASMSKVMATATFAPFGHAAGCSDRPARTVFTTVFTLSIVHCHPGFAFVCGTGCACARSSDGSRVSSKVFIAA